MGVLKEAEIRAAQELAEKIWSSEQWPDCPEQALRKRGISIEERPLSVGWARVMSRADLLAGRVYLDNEAIASYAAECGRSEAQVRRRALAHELGHFLCPNLSGAAAEAAADWFAAKYCASVRNI
ncbi:hypothetical protein IJT17_05910 [bacterium]|nr:hypothetical protein [bacterium]